MKVINGTFRMWLIQNSYDDIAEMINTIIDDWKGSGNKQRRNWWDVLAGNLDGTPKVIFGKTFPILRTAQIRQGLRVTQNAISKENESPPPSKKKK